MNAITISPFGAGATEAQLLAIEERLGATLPKEYRDFLARYNGGSPSQSRDQLTAFSVRWADQEWALGFTTGFLRCLYTADNRPGVSLAWAHSDHVFRQVRLMMPQDVVPIGGDLGSNSILLGISGRNRGKVLYWIHDFAPDDDAEPTYDNVGFIANSFTEFLDSLYPWKEDSK